MGIFILPHLDRSNSKEPYITLHALKLLHIIYIYINWLGR